MKLLNVTKVSEVKNKLSVQFKNLLKIEEKSVEHSLNYYLAEDVYSKCNVPDFNKSRVDGFAVLFKNCKIAYEMSPVVLNVVGRLEIGDENEVLLNDDECMYVPTGGMIPKNSDAVVMIENTNKLSEDMIAIHKSVTKNENVTLIGDDVKKGTLIIKKGTKIDERIMGILCSQGILKVKVYKKLKVFILSSGDELINYDEQKINVGQTREINSIFCANALKNDSFEIIGTKLIKDDKELYKHEVLKIVNETDANIIITSGGSSKGDKDFTLQVFEEITGNVFCNGISIKPGKPTILASKNDMLFIGLPGHPVSSYMVLKHVILQSFYSAINYEKNNVIIGKLKYNMPNSQGREILCLTKFVKSDDEYLVEPIFYNSSNINTLGVADGYFVIKETVEGLKEGENVEVHLF